jgi:pimeloyl-ACP methyl ester carboxylesterase
MVMASDGVAIAGSYYEPARRPAPMALLIHMPTRTRADWRQVAGHLAARGVGALAIDLRGHGESGGAPPADSATAPDALQDIRAALTWLKQHPDALPGRIVIVGASLGANLAAIAAAADPDVAALVLLSATLDFRGLKTEAALRQFGPRPVLLLVSREDAYATRSARELSRADSPQRELRVLEGAGHGTMMLRRQPELMATIVDWVCGRLL